MRKWFSIIVALSLVGSAHFVAYAEKKETVSILEGTSVYKIMDKEGNFVVLNFEFQPKEVTVVVTVPNTAEKKVIKVPIGQEDGRRGGSSKGGEEKIGNIPKPNDTFLFSDTVNHWARDEIQLMVLLGLLKGYPDGTFRPDKDITKAEFGALLTRAIQLYDQVDTNQQPVKMHDVKETDWFYSYVQVLEERGNISEIFYPKLLLNPNKPIFREEAAFWLAREVEQSIEDSKLPFKDQEKILFKEEVSKVTKAKLLKGFPDGTFGPFEKTTRAQAASIVLRLLNQKGIVKK
ncbi:S-layer homology domain-containing protein [Brevibacillus borstelensis]|jgi:hypothetical protein|uniref:S-layer homology domain-containing protein n=1 Tax=Brevibacillus borstelensis TaxID=45462 RepID=UPI00046A499A|nr:S-layer homology domain-containing protein [Brevibacillus borstelensis]